VCVCVCVCVCVSKYVCEQETSTLRRPRPELIVAPQKWKTSCTALRRRPCCYNVS